MSLTTVPAGADACAERVRAAIDADGAAVIGGVLHADECAAIVAEIERLEHELETPFGANDFEGFHTKRIFNAMAKSPRVRGLVTDPVVLPAVEGILGPGLLLSGTTSMHIGPGETPQLLHSDDGMVTLPRPHPATMVTTLWALSPFTATNGATRLVVGSHRFERAGPARGTDSADAIAAEMPAGSVLVLHASAWHGGGPNTTEGEHRYGLSIQYVAGWCRQQQNLMLGLDRALVATFPPLLQELVGYGLYCDVMGHVDRQHPSVLLGAAARGVGGWDELEGPGGSDGRA